jgi:hypothetical protein
MKELLEIRQRFKRSDKKRFVEQIERKLQELGFDTEQKHFGKILKSINIETKNDNPDYIFIAHYDTGTILPFWFNWSMRLFGINRQLLIMFLIGLSIPIITGLLGDLIPNIDRIVSILLGLSMLTIFIPNKSNLDDNTSGIITLLSLAERFQRNRILNVKFIFVDNEELGLFGSRAHFNYLKKNHLIADTCKVFSIDCVGGQGDIPLIISNSRSDYLNYFKNKLTDEFGKCKAVKMELPASDNYSFKKIGALNLSFVSKSIIPGGYYVKNIHSFKDKQIDIDRINRISDFST